MREAREKLDEQNVLWQQTNSANDEISAWLKVITQQMEHCDAVFEPATVQSVLSRYKVADLFKMLETCLKLNL